jgi:hypothetical protein
VANDQPSKCNQKTSGGWNASPLFRRFASKKARFGDKSGRARRKLASVKELQWKAIVSGCNYLNNRGSGVRASCGAD